MDLQLKNKVIIVTGGAKGIGEGIVKVLACGRRYTRYRGKKPGRQPENAGSSTAGRAPGLCRWKRWELTRPEACKKAVDAVLAKYGQYQMGWSTMPA